MTCEYLIEKMKKDPTVVAITSGTPTILGFTQEKRKQAGRQFVDVGIAEETAVALASGIAKGGGKPVYGVYSALSRGRMTRFHRICVLTGIRQRLLCIRDRYLA